MFLNGVYFCLLSPPREGSLTCHSGEMRDQSFERPWADTAQAAKKMQYLVTPGEACKSGTNICDPEIIKSTGFLCALQCKDRVTCSPTATGLRGWLLPSPHAAEAGLGDGMQGTGSNGKDYVESQCIRITLCSFGNPMRWGQQSPQDLKDSLEETE